MKFAVTGLGVVAVLLAGCAGVPTGSAEGGRAASPRYTTILSVVPVGSTPPSQQVLSAPPSLPVPLLSAQPVPPAAKSFAWTGPDDAVPDDYTLTVLRGLSPREALATVAPRPRVPMQSVHTAESAIARLREYRYPETQPLHYTQLVAAVRRGPYTLVLEDNNFLATDKAARLAARGDATVLYQSVDGGNSYTVARSGRVVREFEPQSGYDLAGRPLPEETGLPFDGEDTYQWTDAMAFELTRRLTGYCVSPSDFDIDTYELALGADLQR